ncbi:3-ketoacyl-ACP reductase [Ruegeria sp. 2205SS24-7]|uniref:3-ketoacyl-ACP reductase n=1 Tax=Ruegeria discodermiae TaxID=3064389 RepID=UPI0027406828|nr:3-ketoacyl-ACP reductase [Ruegeria sp. 2205SS24-7]MDP5218503.1 3-ketoacyl-ACP reductase [Ruegeria sp. 2205SS24-7]
MSGVALITGGQRGIGLGIARALAGAGCRVALAAERPEDDPDVIAALSTLPGSTYHQHDLRDLDRIAELFDAVEAAHGAITTLVSNAGITSPSRGDMLDILPESFDLVMDVNLRGAFFLAQEAARRMSASHTGVYRSILFVTSVSAEMVSIERAEYCLSKSGAAMMAQLFAARLSEDGIGVFELRPGIIATEMTAGVRDRYDSRIKDGLVPAKRWGQPSDIGQVVVPLARGQLAYSTGAVIPVDGGLSIHRL